jgi:hypothetical protein
MKWVIPLSDHDFSGLLDALRARPAPKAPVFPEDFKEYRPFWTGLVELRRPRIGAFGAGRALSASRRPEKS